MNRYLFVLFIIFKYYSNDSLKENIPNEFRNWQYFNKDILIK